MAAARTSASVSPSPKPKDWAGFRAATLSACQSSNQATNPTSINKTPSTTQVANSSTTTPVTLSTGGFQPLSFTAVSTNQFWVLGTNCHGKPSCTPSIVETTDSGKHFVKIPLPSSILSSIPSAQLSPGAGLGTLRFATSTDGYLLLRASADR